MAANSEAPTPKPSKLNVSLDYRVICIVLVVIIAGMFAVWRPWDSQPSANDRTIQVTGDTTIKATPDEFVFYPSYQFKNADKDAALKDMTAKSDELVAKLKEQGVKDEDIKTNANSYDYLYYYPPQPEGDQQTYTLQLTVTAHNRDQAQKIQNYLLTTTPTGSVTPQATFSEAKRKQLESQARDAATKDARAKADQSAKNLGFKVGKVKSVTDGSGFGGIVPLAAGSAMDTKSSSPNMAVQPGENPISYTVTVNYYVK